MSDQQPAPDLAHVVAGGDHERRYTFYVTHHDIEVGKPRSCLVCPIALAIYHKLLVESWDLDGPGAVMVFGDHVNVFCRDGSVWYGELPSSARTFILGFDGRGPYRAAPFSFDVGLHPTWGTERREALLDREDRLPAELG